MLAEREATFDDMKRLYTAWREVSSHLPSIRMGTSKTSGWQAENVERLLGPSQVTPDLFTISTADRHQITDHLNTLLAMASQSPDVRQSLRSLSGASAESFIELLEQVSPDFLDAGFKLTEPFQGSE